MVSQLLKSFSPFMEQKLHKAQLPIPNLSHKKLIHFFSLRSTLTSSHLPSYFFASVYPPKNMFAFRIAPMRATYLDNRIILDWW
jgi:hypothetical protein